MKITIRIQARTDGQYVAHCPSLPGCMAIANTRKSAENKMREAVVGYLASMDAVLPASVTLAEVQEFDASRGRRDDQENRGIAHGAGHHPVNSRPEMTS